MNKTGRLSRLKLTLVALALLPPVAHAEFNFVRAKNGVYGGAEVGFLTSDFSREKLFEEVIQGTNVDFTEIIDAIDSYTDTNGIRPHGSVIRITIDKNNTFGLGDVADFNRYFATIASTKSGFEFTRNSVPDLDYFYENIGAISHQVGLLDVTRDRALMFRFFGGVNFKAFFGVEVAGWLTTDILVENRPIQFSYEFTNPGSSGTKALLSSDILFSSTTNLYGLEAAGKLRLPLHPFFGYLKAGVAFVYGVTEANLKVTGKTRSFSSDSGSEDTEDEVYNESVTHSNTEIRPMLGAGLAFRAGESSVVNVSYHHYERSGEQEALNAVMVSFTLEFTGELCGDLYC